MGRKIEKNLYCIRRYYGGGVFFETDSISELAKFVAEYEANGNIITSVVEVLPDGRNPKVAIKSTKEYKKSIKELLKA